MNPIVTGIIVFWISYVGAMFTELNLYRLPLALALAGISALSEWFGLFKHN